MRIIAFVLFAIAFAVGGIIPRAVAQSASCLPLQMELAELEKSGGSTGNDRAIRQELSRLQAQERRNGCRSFFQVFTSGIFSTQILGGGTQQSLLAADQLHLGICFR